MNEFKKLFNDIAGDLKPKLTEGWETVQGWTKRLFHRVDSQLLKAKKLLQETATDFIQYVKEREAIIQQIEMKEQHIRRLRSELRMITLRHEMQVGQLHAKLEQEIQELLEIQSTYLNVEDRMHDQLAKISELEQEKQALDQERKRIRQQYVAVQQDLLERERLITAVLEEVNALKEQQNKYEEQLLHSHSSEERQNLLLALDRLQAQLQEREAVRIKLENELEGIKREKRTLEQELLEKSRALGGLQKDLAHVTTLQEQTSLERERYKQSLRDARKQIRTTKAQVEQYKSQVAEKQRIEAQLLEELDRALQEKEILEEEHNARFDEFANLHNEAIAGIKAELTEQINENNLLAYQYDQKSLSKEEAKILEREYEPRFQEIYPNMRFSPKFFHDFFELTVSDRIKAELKIAQLHYQFDAVDSKIRKNTVHTPIGAVMEFPFSQEGRIYFRRQDNLMWVYRLNRTKNEQPMVIHWLRTSLK